MSMPTQNAILERWNAADAAVAAREILACCGSGAWADSLAARRPFASPGELFMVSDMIWQNLAEDDWREAFASHPRIGETHVASATEESLAWSGEEQRAAASEAGAKQALAKANREYETKFGRIFIVCAAGRSAAEILAICNTRMNNDSTTEMLASAEEQRQITQLRLRRWLGVN
ncbi:MAG: 2-oxo-4-hydroxy-4-carboxy-5-ureidoimidazoline decarboxylase [Acidobacteriaceae bacterium]